MISKPKTNLVPASDAHGTSAATPAAPLDPNRELSPQEEDLIARLLACAMGLPRVCRFKACRRRKRCVGPDVVCAKHHSGLVAERLEAAIARIAVPEP